MAVEIYQKTAYAMQNPSQKKAPTQIFSAFQQDLPYYVDNEYISFKHEKTDLNLRFLSSHEKAQQAMIASPNDCVVYFPPDVGISFDREIENRLSNDLLAWNFFKSFPQPLAHLGIDMSRYCSLQTHISYDRRVLLHHHLTWIFLMDEVCEKFPIHQLHANVEKMYLDNLKNIMNGLPVADLMQYESLCPKELLQEAINVQEILAQDLMPLKRKLLSTRHVQLCVDTLSLFFDKQYEEGHMFCAEETSENILRTRGFTIGTTMVFLLFLQPAHVELFSPEDPCLIQISIFIALFHDMIGLHKDLESLQKHDDGSAYLNLVRVSMRDNGWSEKEASRVFAQILSHHFQSFEFFMATYTPIRQEYYHEVLKFALGLFDYHLMGIMESGNQRYGWRKVQS
ncbi:Terpenoid synthase [Penicillium frequentans]|uniref:Terpenoid synthase n=1 Tax=Penicillium frequentans TaxID=3151616 RepID=A0AAD6D5U3_9EURO|nr:Terpenoid synthase [Penicillium glabrum]